MNMARTLDQIIAELNPTYAPQVESLQKQQAMIPGQIASQEQALNAQKDQGYADILSGARSRGTGIAFGGIPLAEQAKYNATQYAPALANLRQQGQQQAMSLQDAILGVQERQRSNAQDIYQTEQDRAYNERQAALSRAATAQQQTDLSRYFNTGTTTGAATTKAGYTKDDNGGFSFYGADNTPITAGQYAQQNKMDIREVLQGMAATDPSAAILYNKLRQAGDDKALYNMIGSEFNNFRNILGGFTIPTQYANRAVANKLSTELRF